MQRYNIHRFNPSILVLFFCLLLNQETHGQNEFRDSIYSGVRLYDSIHYSTAKNFGGTPTNLHLDVYTPNVLDNRERPLIIFSHGGSFLTGNRKSEDLRILCKALAKRGYICASIDYRKGINLLKDLKTEYAKAVWRTMQDHNTAVRYFKYTYANQNQFHIDTSQIYLAGVSAGAIASLQAAFLRDDTEIPTEVSTQSLGGIDAGEHLQFSSQIAGVINLFGAITDKEYMDYTPNFSICNLHGSSDATVPYKTGVYSPNNYKIGELHGSFVVDSLANELGIDSDLKTLPNKGHVPYTREPKYIDTTLNYIVDCMFSKVKLGGIVGIPDIHIIDSQNPFSFHKNKLVIDLEEDNYPAKIRVFNSYGHLVYKDDLNIEKSEITLSKFSQGSYLVHVSTKKNSYNYKILLP